MRYIKQIILKLMDYLKIADIILALKRRDIILLYHSIEMHESGYENSVSLENFILHIDVLSQHHKFVSLDKMLNESSKFSRVAITFDDAYSDFYTVAFPVLAEKQIPVTIFVPTIFIETHQYLYENAEKGYRKQHLSWEQMRELHSSKLVEFESHAHSHFDSVNNIDKLKDDVMISIAILEKELGRRPRYFAYPFGDCNMATHDILLDCGFEQIFTTQSISVRPGKIQGRYNIRRSNEGVDLFKLTIAGIKS